MIRLNITNTYTLVEAEKYERKAVSNALKYSIKGGDSALRRIEEKTGKKWDGMKSMFDGRRKMFPAGLTARVVLHLKQKNIPYQLIDSRIKSSKKPVWPVSLHNFSYREYQEASIAKFLTKHKGILKLGTGAGKTEVACAISKAIGLPTIFLTNRVHLAVQAAERFQKRWPEMKNNIGLVGDGNFSMNFLTFATVQSMHNAALNYGSHFTSDLKQFGLMVVDEAHRIGAKQFYETTALMTGAYYRLGLTATPFMNYDVETDLRLEGMIGRVVHEVSPSELIRQGYLAKPYFKFFEINKPSELHNLSNWRDVYEYGIVKNDFRNQVVALNAEKLINMGHKVLIVIQEIEHGKRIKEKLDKTSVVSQLVTGADETRSRLNALDLLSKGATDAIICSNIFDEGVDSKDVSAAILAGGGQAPHSLFQRAGRTLRKKDDEKKSVIIDFIDRQHPILLRHSNTRYNLVKSEPEFAIL